jgi:hypothetical protein
MVKRVLAAFAVILTLAFIQVTSVSAGTIGELGKPFPIDVKAVEIIGSNVYKNNVDGDSASVTTKNVTTVSVMAVEGKFEPGLRLVIREITAEETEPYGWFCSVMEGIGTDILPFDIYFEKDGQRIPLNIKVRITITLPDGYSSPIVCYVTTDGKVEILQSSAAYGKISFKTEHTSYYVIANNIKAPDDFPKTGDNADLVLYIVLMAFSASILIYGLLKKGMTDLSST